MSVMNHSANPEQLKIGAEFLHAFLECSDAIQEDVRALLSAVFDPETDDDDRLMTLATLADALFPNMHEGKLGLDLEQSEQMGSQASAETRQAIEDMDREEAVFAERLSEIMKERNLTQTQLAEMSGVGQPAISNMLNRQCRPQRRTIQKFASALGVNPQDLWPSN